MPNSMLLYNNFYVILQIVEWISIAAGFCLVFSAMFKLKRYGESRTMMSSQMHLSGPLFTLIAGVALLLLPTTIEVLLSTIWSTGSVLEYTGSRSGLNQYMDAIYLAIRIVGIVSIIRGIITLSKLGGAQGQPGMMGKAFGFIFGGVFCVNIVATIDIIKTIFNIST